MARDKYLANNYAGYWGKLSSHDLARLRTELKPRLYENAQEICAFIKAGFGVAYRAEGLVPLLHRIGFEYKKTKQVPCKADEVAQAEFIAKFAELQTNKEADEVHYFIDVADADLK